MKQFASFYFVVVLIWTTVATLFGVNSIPGRGAMYNAGRNLPSALIWPVGVIKSPYTLYQWVTTPSRSEAFKAEYSACMLTMNNESVCGCAVDKLEQNFTDDEMKQASLLNVQGNPPEKLLLVIQRTAMECRQ